MSNESLVGKIKTVIVDSGYKLTAVSEKTGIEYQRLHRILNQGALLSAREFLLLCKFLDIPHDGFIDETGTVADKQKES